MAVSRFLTFPIQNNFSENRPNNRNPLWRNESQHNVGGYMRKERKSDLTLRIENILVSSSIEPAVVGCYSAALRALQGPIFVKIQKTDQ